eukprot:scaffold80443_cov63-Phaeocystis_antarctica.AAC.1
MTRMPPYCCRAMVSRCLSCGNKRPADKGASRSSVEVRMRGTIRRVGDSQFDEMQMTLCVCRTTLWRRFSLASSSLPLPSGTVSTPSTSKKRTFMGGLGRRYVVIAHRLTWVDAAKKCSYRIGWRS